MKPKRIGPVFAIIMATVLGTGWWYATSAPPHEPTVLPARLLDLRSSEGQALLDSTPLRADYDVLTNYFVEQSRRAYCGVASATIVVNALHPSAAAVTQDTFFTSRATAVRSELKVTMSGMTLDELADLLRAHDLSVSVVHASDGGLDAFRSAARTSLADESDLLLVNYDRATLDQGRVGHISPVAAYHAATDRVLVLDVAAYRYPPTWINAQDLWAAMNTVDRSSGRTRGYLLVRNAASPAPPP